VHESMNLASVWSLPILFFCENNDYGMSAAASRMVSTSSIASRADAYSISHATVDGNDVEAVYAAAQKAVNIHPYYRQTLFFGSEDLSVLRTLKERSMHLPQPGGRGCLE